jgi:lipoyl(octanoyl) transferase
MDFIPATWRLIQTPPAHGAWNMAVDEAILEATVRGEVLPTLRLYAWEPACLSLGYAQPVTDVDRARLAANGWDLVRRPTGGRAILHVDELTYSVCGPQTEPRLDGSVLESYRTLSAALLIALQRLGIAAQALPKAIPVAAPGPTLAANGASEIGKLTARPTSSQNPVCFESPSDYEITMAGKKLVGSAQARRKAGVLQHGSLPLFGDLRRITQSLAFPDEDARRQAAERLLERATTLEAALGSAPAWEQVARAFRDAFQEQLNLELQPGELNAQEQARAHVLVQEKYAHPSWNERV